MDSRNKLHSRLRLWEFPDQYIIEPANGSGAPCLDISRVDASMKLIDQVGECDSLRVPKIHPISGVVGMLKLLAGSYLVVVTESERVGSFLGHPIFKITSLKVLPCDHSLKNSPEEQKKMETEFSRLLSVAEKTTGLFFSYQVNLTLSSQRLHDLGHYIVAVNRDMAPVPQKGGLEAVANFPVALAVVLLSFWFATMSMKQAGSDYKHKHLFFSLLWTGICVGVAALVRANGRIFCNRPRLHKPRG
ncbi:hypothetical protein BRARA_I03482 [Brassica rapa]|uniref:SAC domain-containing protein n=1 Tax=Brassica campestris TaxID=3711 RepID=A0A397XZN4_BRACM|nr:hypothetical protein BRARA_I03482 [Brassica rapa]